VTKQEEQISRPATLYVERVETRPSITEYFEKRRVSVIDIELTQIQAVQIMEYLRERSAGGDSGSIRIRFLGRLIHL